MTKDVFLCANKSKLTCGDKRECEQFFGRGSIPFASPKMATHSNTKYIELEESNLPWWILLKVNGISTNPHS